MRLWSARRRELTETLRASSIRLWTLGFSPDGRRLVVAGGGGHLSVWRVGRRLRRQATLVNIVTSVAFTPDGRRLASATDDGEVRVWDIGREVELHTLRGSDSAVDALAFSPGGRLLASGDTDGIVRLWDPVAGMSLASSG